MNRYESCRVAGHLFAILSVRWLVLIFPIAFVAFMLGALLIDNPLHYTLGDLWGFLFTDDSSFAVTLAFCFSVLGIVHFYTLPRIKGAIQRNVSARGNIVYAPLAQPLPVPLATALTLPVSVRAKINQRRGLLELAPVLALLAVVTVNVFVWRNGIGSIVGIVVSMWLAFGQPWMRVGKPRSDIVQIIQITVTDGHLLVTRGRPKLGGASIKIPWNEGGSSQ
jgi:hypothetical protein